MKIRMTQVHEAVRFLKSFVCASELEALVGNCRGEEGDDVDLECICLVVWC